MTLTPFINDPQPPFFHNGRWHFYYLWNEDFPSGNGTAWRHVVSTDLKNWHDAGIAIQKYTTPNGDPWSGCAVVDMHNTAGFGANAIIVLCTMPDDNTGQSTARWISRDGGYTYSFDSIVMNHPARNAASSAFRDPRIVWMARDRCWILVLAEVNKIGIYRSIDLKSWTYVSSFKCDWLGTLECPALFPINAYDADNNLLDSKWVMMCGANGFACGFTTGTHYWIGSFDGLAFTTDDMNGQWLDSGADFYASVVFGRTQISNLAQDTYFVIAWKNNWDYATDVTRAGYFGAYSTVRVIALRTIENRLKLTNTMWWNGTAYSSAHLLESRIFTRLLSPLTPQPLQTMRTGAYLFVAAFSVRNGKWPRRITITLQSGAGAAIELILSSQAGYVTLLRSRSGFTPSSGRVWNTPRRAPLTFNLRVSIFALINADGIEVIFNDGELSMTSLVFPTLHSDRPAIAVEGGHCNLDYFSTRPYADAA